MMLVIKKSLTAISKFLFVRMKGKKKMKILWNGGYNYLDFLFVFFFLGAFFFPVTLGWPSFISENK